MESLKKLARRYKEPFKTVPLRVDLEHYPTAKFIRGTSIMVPEEHAQTVYEVDVVEEKYWYWDEKGASTYIAMTQEPGYDVLKGTQWLLEREMPKLLNEAFAFFKKAHPNSRGLPPVELVVLGVGSAAKETMILNSLVNEYERHNKRKWQIFYTPVDISFPLLQNSLRSIFADSNLRTHIYRKNLIVQPILTDFLTGLARYLRKNVVRFVIAQGLIWNAPIPLLFNALKDLMTPDSLLLMDVEFVGGRSDEQITKNYEGKAAKDFFYHPLELLQSASQTKYDDHFMVHGELVLYKDAFTHFTLRNGQVIPRIVQRDTLDEFAKEYGLSTNAKSKIRLSPGSKDKTVVLLYQPTVQKGNLRTIVLGYSTRFEYKDFVDFLIQQGFDICVELLDNKEDPTKAIFGQYLLKLGSESHHPTERDIYVGSTDEPAQWGIIGKSDGAFVKFDLNKAHTIFICGKPGSGKGYTIGVLSEMLVGKSIPKISKVLDEERATIIVFHKSKDEKSDFWSISEKNTDPKDCKKLKEEYGVEPYNLVSRDDVRIFIDPSLIDTDAINEFKEEYGTDVIFPFNVNPSTITGKDWDIILSTVGSIDTQARTLIAKRVYYTIKEVKKKLGTVNIEHVKKLIEEDKSLSNSERSGAISILDLLKPYLTDGNQHFVSKLKLGGVNIFDFRDKGELTLYPTDVFSIMTLILSVIQTSKELKDRPVVLVMDEAHEYFKKGMSEEFVDVIENLLRRFRHGRKWLLMDTQFADDVHPRVVELADVKIVHSSNPVENKLLKADLGEIADKPILPKQAGRAYIVANEATEKGPILVDVRPRLTKHGGSSKTLIG